MINFRCCLLKLHRGSMACFAYFSSKLDVAILAESKQPESSPHSLVLISQHDYRWDEWVVLLSGPHRWGNGSPPSLFTPMSCYEREEWANFYWASGAKAESIFHCRSFDPLSDPTGKDLLTLILQREKQHSVELSDLSKVHVSLEYSWKREKQTGKSGLNGKWSGSTYFCHFLHSRKLSWLCPPVPASLPFFFFFSLQSACLASLSWWAVPSLALWLLLPPMALCSLAIVLWELHAHLNFRNPRLCSWLWSWNVRLLILGLSSHFTEDFMAPSLMQTLAFLMFT